ncbi:MAG TPA: tetratricopeptide repeat protein [Bacteroidales bacterium]|nr:tetratricopeptide repeat protein [Bacteroidales bacterium]
MSKSLNAQTKIDELNNELWNKRFSDSQKVAAEALKNLARAEKIEYERGIAYSKLTFAACNFLQSKNDIAIKFLTDVFRWFEENMNEPGYVRALLLKGNIFESFGEYEKTLKLWLEAYNVSRDIPDRESEGESCNQLGLIYSRLCNFSKSIEYFEKGLQIREELGDENGVASSLNRIGMVLRQIKKYDESLEYYFRSLEIRKKNNQLSAIPWTLLGIASTYEEQNKYPEALDYYEQGMKGSDKRCTLQCIMGSGRIYSKTSNSDRAQERLEESLLMAQELSAISLVADAYSGLATHYESTGDSANALKYLKLYYKIRESVQSDEAQNKLRNIEIAHAVEKSEQEKEIFRLRNVELKEAYDIIEENNREITASINYASRIQRAMLPEPEEIEGLYDNYFILFKPKDIVSGDFYWFTNVDNKLVAVAGDCTGHGVPGALMSMLGISFLEEIVNNREITESGKILDELRKEVQKALRQKGSKKEAKDGMDISLCVIDKSKNILQFSGAYNNLYLIRDNELIEYRADRMPIAVFDMTEEVFKTNIIDIKKGDLLYMFSDGYADQFGGPNFKKYKNASLKSLLLSIHKFSMRKQQQNLEDNFLSWKGINHQTDDVLIIGLKA